MTREKAIEELKEMIKYEWGTYFTNTAKTHVIALEMAIKALEQEPIIKKDLGVDWDELKRKIFMEVNGGTDDRWLRYIDVCDNISNSIDEFKADLPSVTPQEPHSFKWCTDCKEYDQEKHCCHRWSKVIRNTVEEMKQEPILDKIRAEIAKIPKKYPMTMDYENGIKEAIGIIDKYKAEEEPQKSEVEE